MTLHLFLKFYLFALFWIIVENYFLSVIYITDITDGLKSNYEINISIKFDKIIYVEVIYSFVLL